MKDLTLAARTYFERHAEPVIRREALAKALGADVAALEEPLRALTREGFLVSCKVLLGDGGETADYRVSSAPVHKSEPFRARFIEPQAVRRADSAAAIPSRLKVEEREAAERKSQKKEAPVRSHPVKTISACIPREKRGRYERARPRAKAIIAMIEAAGCPLPSEEIRARLRAAGDEISANAFSRYVWTMLQRREITDSGWVRVGEAVGPGRHFKSYSTPALVARAHEDLRDVTRNGGAREDEAKSPSPVAPALDKGPAAEVVAGPEFSLTDKGELYLLGIDCPVKLNPGATYQLITYLDRLAQLRGRLVQRLLP